MRGEFLDLDGVRLYYYAAGSRGAGDSVVLLHGFPTSGHLWSDVVPLLPAGHRVVVLDLLGFGRSDPPAGRALDIPAHGERLVAVLDRLGIARACLIGHDVGAGVAQWVAVRHPGRVSRLGLVSAVAFDAWPSRAAAALRLTLPFARHLPANAIRRALSKGLLRGYSDRERGAHELDVYLRPFAGNRGRDVLVDHLLSLRSRDTQALAPLLAAVRCPAAVLWGADDPFLSPELGRRLAAAIPDCSYTEITGARHFLPEEHAASVATFARTLLAR